MTDDHIIQRRIERAFERIAQGDLDGAVDVLHEVLALDPDVVEAHALLAMCLVDLRAIGPARAEAETAVALDGDSAFAHNAMGHVCIAQGKLERAAHHLELALALDPSNASNYESMASLDRMRGRPHRHWLDQALELDPDDPDLLAAVSRERFEAGDFAEARRFAEAALQLNAESSDALLAMARVLLAEKQLDDAREHVVAALRNNAVDEEALRLLVMIRARQSPLLGLWMRWQVWLETMHDGKRVAWLVGLLVGTRLLSQIFIDLGWPSLASAVRTVWLAFVAYTWVGPLIFQRMLARELADVELDDEY
jgi:Tfp pilus assembly protein PilF